MKKIESRITKVKEDLGFRLNVPVYWLNPPNISYDTDFAKGIRKGVPFNTQVYIAHKEIEAEEIVKVVNRSGKIDHWLVKNEILSGINKKGNMCSVKTTPIRKVEIEKKHPTKKDYVIIKGKYKKL